MIALDTFLYHFYIVYPDQVFQLRSHIGYPHNKESKLNYFGLKHNVP